MHGLKTITSKFPVKETIARIIETIEQQGWHLFARIDLILFGHLGIGGSRPSTRR